ncbi:response regulator transcription factor [Paenibacillus endoradicis]|uniref:response regulator transcription factor n=1 Tax=Paenibacillus endoradicis TaxID=2972487 RepID=UPI002159725A|nr:response regulator transcription factor [Paenibacillus endoradicis]MCR8655805.1 response regulator transcription factor [Paenibacillus endoradicis]MCR8658131.1 response regulator transcription factor [Paenibacillus endoradicis]
MNNLNGIKILLVDDEESILQFLELGLMNEGATIETAANGILAIEKAEQFKPHVVILDVMMPVMNGFDVCKSLKDKGDEIAIIMLTAKDDIEDRVNGFTLGADDYLIKPFSFSELIARIHARVRNQFPNLLGEVRYGLFILDDRRKEITFDDQVLELSPTEYELLRLLLLHNGAVLSKTNILDKVWGYDFGGEHNIVEVYVRAIREKLGDKEHRIIRTLRGAGYRMDV